MELNSIIESNKEEMFETLSQLIRIPSVAGKAEEGAPHGKEVQKALDFMLAKAKSMGFAACDFDHQVGYCEYGEGELAAVVAHLDVVPEGTGWTHEPFGGERTDGIIYGRGAVDDKGPAVASLYALYALKESGLKINKKVRIMFGTDEETGSSDMEYFFSHGGEQPVMGFTPDANYPVICGEKGILIDTYKVSYDQNGCLPKLVEIKGGTAANVVPANAYALVEGSSELFEKIKKFENEKIRISKENNFIKIETFGVSAHGMEPEKGINAIALLINILTKIPFEKKLSDAFRFLNEKIGTETNGNKLGIYLRDDLSGEFTFNLGTVNGNENSFSTGVNYRYPVTKTAGDCVEKAENAFKTAAFELIERNHEPALYIDPESTLIRSLVSVYEEQSGQKGDPICIGGGTYAKAVKNIVAFGPMFPDEPAREHKPDECIEEEKILLNCKIYAHAILRISQ